MTDRWRVNVGEAFAFPFVGYFGTKRIDTARVIVNASPVVDSLVRNGLSANSKPKM